MKFPSVCISSSRRKYIFISFLFYHFLYLMKMTVILLIRVRSESDYKWILGQIKFGAEGKTGILEKFRRVYILST